MSLDKAVSEQLTKQLSDFRQAVTAHTAATSWTGLKLVILGNGQNPPKVIVPDSQRDGVKNLWCYEDNIDGKGVFQVANLSSDIPLSDTNAGLRVWVGYPEGSTILSVQRIAHEALMQTGGVTPMQMAVHTAGLVTPDSYQQVKVVPDTTGAAKIRVTGGHYRIGNDIVTRSDINSTNLNASIPTAAGYFRWVLLCITRLGNVTTTNGDLYATATTVDIKDQVPRSYTLGQLPIAWVKLTQGMTVLTTDDILPIQSIPYTDNLSDSGNGIGHINFEIGDTPVPYPDADNLYLYPKSDKRFYILDEDGVETIVGSGSVTSVALTMPTDVFDVAGSPITESGTLAVTFDTQTTNKVFAAPDGSTGTPTFRVLVKDDIPWAIPGTIGSTTPNTGAFTSLVVTTLANITAGTAATVPLTINLAASQSANALSVVDNSLATLAAIGFQGHAAFAGTGISANNAVNVNKNFGHISATTRAGRFSATATLTSNSASQLNGNLVSATMNQNGFNATAANTGMRALDLQATVSGTSGTVTGASGAVFTVENTSTGILSNAYGVYIILDNQTTGTISNAYGIRIPGANNAGTMTTFYGINISEQTAATTNYALYTAGAGHIDINVAGTAAANVRIRTDSDTANVFSDSVNNRLGNGTDTPSTKFHSLLSSAATNVVTNVATLTHNSTGTAAANFGTGLIFEAESTTTNGTSLGRLYYFWSTATHASRKAEGVLSVFDTAERTAIRFGTDGSNPLIGLFGVTPVGRSSAYTPTNVTTDRSYDANATTLDELADVVGTMIADLQSIGIFQ